MPAAVYECMFLLDTNKVSGDVPGAAAQLHAVLEKNGAEVLASRPWDELKGQIYLGSQGFIEKHASGKETLKEIPERSSEPPSHP